MAAVILVGGSGAQDRNGSRSELPGYLPLAELSQEIARRGVVVLRLDDRGAGQSGGTAVGTTTTRSARDAGSAVQWLRGQSMVDATRIGIVGHSEGGLIAMIAASQDSTIRSIALLATPSRPGRELARWQRDWLTASDVAQFPVERRQRMLADAEQSAEVQAARDPWMREWFALDPRLIARQLRGRALIVHGERDRQVPVEQSAELALALRNAGVHVEVVRAPAINHLLLEDAEGDPRLYVRIVDRRIPRALLERIAQWLAARS
jgi:pimeloyl-ACP methyl ester carboxylesterase